MITPAQITEKLSQLQALRPLDADELRILEEKIIAPFEWEVIATSNQIEGNSLTLRETELVVARGLTVAGKPLKDHLEAVNLKVAFDLMKSLARGDEALTERVLREMHQCILCRIDDAWAGRYRTIAVRISGSQHLPPPAHEVESLMHKWQDYVTLHKDTLHPVTLAADAHEKFVTIHPFVDGNGRTARLIMNFILMRHGYPAIIIPADTAARLRYYDALEATQTSGDPESFRQFVYDATNAMLDRYLDCLSPTR